MIPKKPSAKEFVAFSTYRYPYGSADDIFDCFIDDWWREHIEPMFKDAVRVTGHMYKNGAVDFGSGNVSGDTHEALLINIREIEKPKPKTDSEKLKSILDAYENGTAALIAELNKVRGDT